jgi:hypothetical protein
MANNGNIVVVIARIEHGAYRKIRPWFDYYIKILVYRPLLTKLVTREIYTHTSVPSPFSTYWNLI